MKKVEVSRQEFQYPNGKKIFLVHEEWRFTEGEKEDIKYILKNINPKDSIKVFINHLEFFCNAKKELSENPKKKELRLTREKVLTDCKAALGHLKRIEHGKVSLWVDDTVKHYGSGKESKVSNFLVSEFQGAWEAVGPLDKFINLLEKHHLSEDKKQGRGKANADYLVSKIKEIYLEHIGEPSEKEGEPFVELVKKTLEILNLPSQDPSRRIRDALSRL
jgi:hypothetical protein